MSHERLAQLIKANQGALLAHPEAQATQEAIRNPQSGLARLLAASANLMD